MHNTMHNIWAVTRTLLARLRFMAVFAVAAVVVGQWDLIVNRLDQWTRPPIAPDSLAANSDIEYYCPMDGTIQDHGGPCPVCGMPLVKRQKGLAAKLPDNVLARLQITPQRLSLANIATTAVMYMDVQPQVKAVGVIDYDQTRLFDLAARLQGRADELFVTSIGQSVKAGDPLYSLYSPDAYTALREYFQSRKREADLMKQSQPEILADATALRLASERKLMLWGISNDQLAKIARQYDIDGQVPDHVMVYSSATGVVTKKELRQGGYVQAGDVPFTLADLSSVWMNAKIYESDVPQVHIGQEVHVTATAAPGRVFSGKVTFLSYQLDPDTRTLDARVEIPNDDLLLRPGMYATATIQPAPNHTLAIPRTAVIDTGSMKIVYVRSSPETFDKRSVELGPESGDEYPVISGLKEGDQVVTTGTFLVDAEDRLNPPPQSGAATQPSGNLMRAMPAMPGM